MRTPVVIGNGTDPSDEPEQFREHLVKASSLVSEWPEWKQKLLGGVKSDLRSLSPQTSDQQKS
jgi:hypothetical protein